LPLFEFYGRKGNELINEEEGPMTTRSLSFDERKAAEAAFQGKALDPKWSIAGQFVYWGITAALASRRALCTPQEDAFATVRSEVGAL
jgi:hypothetical protein